MTKTELIKVIEELDWDVSEMDDGIEISQHSPAGEDFCLFIAGRTAKQWIKSIEDIYFDPEEHAAFWYGANRGEPSSLKELLEDAEAIAQKIEELKRKVNNFIESKVAPISNRVGECPFCGSLMLDYGALETADQDIYYPWTCSHCGASGREVYELSFAGHYQCVSPNGEYFEEIDNN